MNRWFYPLLLGSLLLVDARIVEASTTECTHDPADGRPKIGLALGGGGARGYAHIGVIKRLHELGVPVDYIAGTSIGAISGGLLAAGLTGPEIEVVARGIDWPDTLDDDTARQDRSFRRKSDDDLALFGPKLGIAQEASLLPQGAISGQKILFLLEKLLDERARYRDFDQLPIPFRAVAANLANGREFVIDRGSVAIAMRASMAVPAVFDPVPYEDKLLVDGGIANNLPVSVVREMGADIVIAVNVGSGLLESAEIVSAIEVAEQLTNILVENTTTAQKKLLGPGDLLLEPQLGNRVGSADFDRIDEGAAIGYEAALAAEEDLRALAVDAQTYARHRAYVDGCQTSVPTIRWVDLDNRSRFRDSIIEGRLDIELDAPLDHEALQRSLNDIYALGFLRLARYEIKERNGELGLVIQVVEDERGSDLLEYGLDVFNSGDATGFNLRVGYLKTNLDDSGAEFRALAQVGSDDGLLLEYYKPFGADLRYILEPQFTYEQREFSEYDAAGNRLNSFEVEQSAITISFGREFGRHAALALRARTFTGEADLIIGDPDIPDFDFDGGEWVLSARYDRLDNAFFPKTGSIINFDYVSSSDALGSDDDYEQITFDALKAWSRDRHSVLLGAALSTTLDDNAPIFALFRAGGFLRLSGFDDNEIAGQHFGLLAVTYRYELGSNGVVPTYIGTSIEYGNVAQERGDMFAEALLHGSIYLGFDTPIGALYTGVGLGENNREQFFFRIGNVFRRSSIGR